MTTIPATGKAQHVRLGGALQVLLVVDSAQLLLRMGEVLRSIEGVKLAAAFTTAAETLDALVWKEPNWHLAYVDLKLRQGGSEDVIRRLLQSPRAGTVVGISDHLWREIRAACAAMGVRDIIEKGDLIAFRGDLETRSR